MAAKKAYYLEINNSLDDVTLAQLLRQNGHYVYQCEAIEVGAPYFSQIERIATSLENLETMAKDK